MTENAEKRRRKALGTSRTIVLVFTAVIALGTLLLLLPVSSRDGCCCGFKTALFTATSSTCVTGLVLCDTWSQWSGFGQFVILALIEIGGLGFMSLASVVIFMTRRKISFQQRILIAESISTDGNGGVMRVQRKLLIGSLLIELAGVIILFIRFLPEFGFSRALKLGIFHSVSAFCNAGFDIMGFKTPGGSLEYFANDPVVLITLSLLIIIGGLGFVVWDDMTAKRKPKNWSVYTKLVLCTTAALILSGWLLNCLFEWNNPGTMGNMSVSGKLLSGFFQSVTLRTAGFATIDQGSLTQAGKALSCIYMLIGGSSGSTAGGLKTVTFVVLVLFLRSRIKGRNSVDVFKRRIDQDQVMNALVLAIVLAALAFTGGLFVSATSGVEFTDALFETVSALGTVGLTTGITAALSLPSHIMLILFMFFGRVGLLTICIGFLRGNYVEKKYSYATTNLLIG